MPTLSDPSRAGDPPRLSADVLRALGSVWPVLAPLGSPQEILTAVAAQARSVLAANMSAVTLEADGAWGLGLRAVSLDDRYAAYRAFTVRPAGNGVYAAVYRAGNQPLRLTQAQLEAHPQWRNYDGHAAQHPPLRGLLAVPVITAHGEVTGVLMVSDRADGGEFDELDEALLIAIAQMASAAIERTRAHDWLQAVLAHAPAAIFLKDESLRYVLANRRAAEMTGRADPAEVIGRTDEELLPPPDAERITASDRAILAGEGDLDEEQPAHWPLAGARVHAQVFAVRDADGRAIGVGGVVSDVTARRTAEAALADTERRYRLLFETALDATVLLDDSGRHVDANAAASELFGMTREQILARTVEDVVVDVEENRDAASAWSAFRAGRLAPDGSEIARGYARVRRADGGIREVEYSAVRDVSPGLHVTVLRDATLRRRLERLSHQRRSVLESLSRLPDGATTDEQAAVACRAILEQGETTGVAFVAADAGDMTLVALETQRDGAVDAVVTLPLQLSAEYASELTDRARSGAWVEDARRVADAAVREAIADTGTRAWAWIPLRIDGRVLGLLAVGDRLTPAELRDRLPYLEQLGSGMGASTLGRALRNRAATMAARARVREIIERRAFHPVFQAVVDLRTGTPVGYEALTRFDDGTRPDLAFAQAAACGLGIELEVATTRAALEASAPLPANCFVDINVSPDFVLAVEPLRSMLKEWGFGVVLELTEHVPVEDYRALRAAIEEIGNDVQLAVDDAGAGFASLRHILELRPAWVKLDRALIAGLEDDPARQALVAGMGHFARSVGICMIAEGVETEAERDTLLALGIDRAQGNLFHRPEPAGVPLLVAAVA